MGYNTGINFDLTFTIKKIKMIKESGFAACRIKLKKAEGYEGSSLPNEIDATGVFQNVYEGDTYEAEVKFIDSEKYGYSIKILDYPKLLIPNTNKELAKFIKTRCSGIGLETIINAIDKIGPEVISKVANDRSLLDGVKGFTEKKKDTFVAFCETNLYFEELMFFLQALKIPASVANKLFKAFGRTSIHKVKTNPYYLYSTKDISFSIADKIAYEYKEIMWDDKRRLVCAVLAYLDSRANNNGDTCVKTVEVVNDINSWILKNGEFEETSINNNKKLAAEGFGKDDIIQAINFLTTKREVFHYEYNKEDYLFKKSYYETEKELANNIKKWLNSSSSTYVPKKYVKEFLKETNTKLSTEQQNAVMNAMANKFSILTGGPGTGKTFTVNAIVKTFKHFYSDKEIILLAPTGRAAERMKAVSKENAKTIHSALRIYDSDKDMSNDDYLLDVDFIIMDEASMTDEWLFNMIFKRVNPKATIVIVGDSDQLPSVNAGSVLHDMIKSQKITVSALTQIYRQEGTSNIVINAHNIKTGAYDDISFLPYNGIKNDFASINARSEDMCTEEILKAIDKYLSCGSDISEILVISPMKKGLLGSKEINSAIQAKVNSKGNNFDKYITGLKEFRVGDRVIHTKNNSKLKVTNGSLGTIQEIYTNSKNKKYIVVQFDGYEEETVYSGEDIRELELGYCITVHKSQGSEAKHIIMAVHETQAFMLTKKLIYTAITRAKETFLCIGNDKLLKERVKYSDNARYSMLFDMLKK